MFSSYSKNCRENIVKNRVHINILLWYGIIMHNNNNCTGDRRIMSSINRATDLHEISFILNIDTATTELFSSEDWY